MKSWITRGLILLISIILVIFVVYLIFFRNIDVEKPDEVADIVEEYEEETKEKLVKIDNLTQLYTVKTCIQSYYENLCAINYVNLYTSSDEIDSLSNTAIILADESNRSEEYFKNVAYSCISQDYIDLKGITQENISEYNVNNFEEVLVEIYNLYYISEYENVFAYFANGIIRETSTNEGIEFNYIVVIDYKNNTFEIYLDNYIEENDFSSLVEGEEIAFSLPSSVENREYNTFTTISIKYEKAVQDTFSNIRRLLLYDIEKAYSILTDDMKEKYPTISVFESYINTNYTTIFSLTYGSYKLKVGDNGAIFVMYNLDSSIRLTAYFDGFSSFTFDIEEL